MKNYVLLPALVCAAIPIFWAALPSSGVGAAPKSDSTSGSASAPKWTPTADPARASATELAWALTPLASPSEPKLRVAATLTAARVDAPGARQAPNPSLPKELKLSEIGPEVSSRLRARLALFEEPTDAMFASWYAGTELEYLARVHFDATIAKNALAAIDWAHPGSSAASWGLGPFAERRASFESEVAWLDVEVLRQLERSGSSSAIRLATRTDDDLIRAYPGPADRYVLRTLMLQEYHSLVRDAARDKFAKVRAMPSEDRAKLGRGFLT